MNGPKKSAKKIGEANGMPSLLVVPKRVMLRNNVGSLDASRSSQLFTFGVTGLSIALRAS